MKTLLKVLLVLVLLWLAWKALSWVIGLMVAGAILFWMFLVLFGVPLLFILAVVYIVRRI